MSAIEYNNLLFEISQRFDELNVHSRLLFMCRGKLASGSEDNIQDALSLFKELEEQNNLGADRLEVIKGLLKSFKEWSLFGKVRKLESKRKKYNELLEVIIGALDELNDVERLISMCRGKISEESEGNIQDVRSLIKELVSQNILGYDRLDILKGILNEIEKSDLVKEVEEFEEQRNQEDEIERKEDEFERRKAQAAAVMSSVGNTLIGVLNIKTVFKVVAGGITVVSTMEVLSRWSTFDQLVTAVNSCVLPAGTSLVQLTDGCVCLTVRAETLSALTTLWKLYQDGTLETRLYDFFVTDEVRERAGGEEVEVNVTIEEQEYEKACLELINEARDTSSSGDGERIRRNSDSAMYFKPEEKLSLLKLKRADVELKFLKGRIAVVEREITAQLSPDIVEAYSPEEKAAILKQHDRWKAREVAEMEERADEMETSWPSTAKLMDPERFAYVQKYLEDVQETRSMITEASDSGLVTHTAASELGTEEISETTKLRLKDLSKEVTQELIRRIEADEAAKEKFYECFGLKMRDRYTLNDIIEDLFPDTTVNLLKKCFEALQLYDLAELLEKVRPRSLHPVLPPEQITQKLQRADDRPTRNLSKVAVLVVYDTFENNVGRDYAEKIRAFFKDLNSRNDVVVITSPDIRNMYVVDWGIKRRERQKEQLKWQEERMRHELEDLCRQRECLEKEPRAQIGEDGKKTVGLPSDTEFHPYQQGQSLTKIDQDESRLKHELDIHVNMVAELKKQIESDIEEVKKLKKLKGETQRAVSTTMDKWIHNQEKFTCVAVFLITNTVNEDYTKAMLDKCVVKKLALIPDLAKLVVGPSGWTRIGKFPETLRVLYPAKEWNTFTWMIEIFNKRWETMDLISMMQEFKRTCHGKANADRQHGHYMGYRYQYSVKLPDITIQDNLSTRLRFQKTEEFSALKATSDISKEI